jgi:hypothetical protein
MAINNADFLVNPATASAENATSGNYDISFTPSQVPAAVCVIIVQGSSSTGSDTDIVSSVTYGIAAGAVPLTRRRSDSKATLESGRVYVYWAAGTFPAGTQTIRIVTTGTIGRRVGISTMTLSDPVNFIITVDADNGFTSDSQANPSWTLATTASVNTVCYEGIHSGLTTMTTTPASGWTLQASKDEGAWGRGWANRSFTGGNLTCGWAAGTADDVVASSIAFKEIPNPISGGSRQPYVSRRAVNRAATW